MLAYAEASLDKLHSLERGLSVTRDAICGLADLYCQGYALPWRRMYAEESRRRIAAPKYPFFQRWNTGSSASQRGVQRIRGSRDGDFDETFYERLLTRIVKGESQH